MGGGDNGAARLARARARIARWRAERGGPGIPLPEAIWSEAVEAARVAGVNPVAQSLRVDRGRLAARLARSSALLSGSDDGHAFVEVDASQLCAAATAPKTVVRLDGGNGERLEVELGDGAVLDIVALARAFWNRRG